MADDFEPTELDVEEETPAAAKPIGPTRQERPLPVGGDPFAEAFEEEEVVLDSFAAWDDMFHLATPRVENRRDPQFAALVQAAMDASPAEKRAVTLNVDTRMDEPADDKNMSAENVIVECVEEPAPDEAAAEWPPLRLAIVSDPAPLQAIPLVAPATTDTARAGAVAGAIDPASPVDGVAQVWPAEVTARLAPRPRSVNVYDITPADRLDALPVLIIEDDLPVVPATKPPVRREEYRHLFSRLRSG